MVGGAAGGGKSDALLMGALRYVNVPSYRALLLRRSFPELLRSLVPKSFQRYPALNGVPNMSTQPGWKFPSGAVIEFGHLQHAYDVHKFQSAEYQYIGFDELTSFTESQYVYMQSRLRGVDGLPVRVRSGTNPGGEGHEWVRKRFAPWLDKQSLVKADPGQKLYYINDSDEQKWVDKDTPGCLSRVFYPARLSDNPYIGESYKDVLAGLDRVSRAQLLEGDWDARPAAGMYFRRDWFDFLPERPIEAYQRIRRWDLASTQDGGDWTVGVLMARIKNGPFIIEDVVRVRLRPKGVQQTVLATANIDPYDTEILMAQDPGQAGVDQMDAYGHLLEGFNIRFERETGDKVTRAQAFSAQCELRNVKLVRAPWNEPFLQCLEAFPEENMHDDDVDAAAGAFNGFNLGKSTAELWEEVGL